MVTHVSWCQCGHTIDDLVTHLFRCPCGNERIATHDTFQDTIASIALESGAHVQKEVSHLFPHHTQWRVDILITKDDSWILTNVVIINSTCINMVQRTSMMITHLAMMAVWENMIILQNNKWRLHFHCYWDVWMSSFSFWFIFYYLCINYYHMSLAIFFNPFDACFLL